MTIATRNVEAVPVSRIFLSLINPRHPPVETEAKAIDFLCKNECVYALARDISQHGLNPLEKFGLLSVSGRRQTTPNYFVIEGNRRVCAIKLLNDPDLAPANLRKGFERLSQSWTPIKTVPGVAFATNDDVRFWLDRIHNGIQGGIGRKEWNAEQKARNDGESRNKGAQALLDYATRKGMLTEEERKGKLTTVHRFLANDVFREIVGFDQDNPDVVGRTRPESEFDILVKRFIRDLVGREAVNSRMNKKEIVDYVRPLTKLPGVSGVRIESEPLTSELAPKAKASVLLRRKPNRPERATHISYEQTIATTLAAFDNQKLKSFYWSICNIDLDPHTPIIAVGVWSFFETLTACAGRNENVSLDSYLSKAKLASYGLTGDTRAQRAALERIRDYGNTTKHHKFAAAFNGEQLFNDMGALTDVILKCITEAADKGK